MSITISYTIKALIAAGSLPILVYIEWINGKCYCVCYLPHSLLLITHGASDQQQQTS